MTETEAAAAMEDDELAKTYKYLTKEERLKLDKRSIAHLYKHEKLRHGDTFATSS